MSSKNSDKSSGEESFVIFSPKGRTKEKRRRRKTNCSKLSSNNKANYRENKISKSLDKMLEKIKTINFKPRNSSGVCHQYEESSKEMPDNLTASDEEKRKYSIGIHKTKSEGELYQMGNEFNKMEIHHGEGKPVPFPLIEPSKQSSETLNILQEAVFIEKSKVPSGSTIPREPIGVSQSNEDESERSVTNIGWDNRKVPNQDTTSRNKSRKLLMEEALRFSGLPEPTDDDFRKIINGSLSDSLDNINKSKKTKNKMLNDGKKSIDQQVPETFSEFSMALSRIFNRSSTRSRQIECSKKEPPKKIKKLDKELYESNEEQKESASSMIINRFLRDVSQNNKSGQRDLMHGDLSEGEFDSQREYPDRSKTRSRTFTTEANAGESFKNLQLRTAENQFEVQPRKDKSKILQSLAVRNLSPIRSDRSRRCKSLPGTYSLPANYFFLFPSLDRRSKSDGEFKDYDLEKKHEMDS